jgi:fucose 4-O-acetylase-like acetyltransferase
MLLAGYLSKAEGGVYAIKKHCHTIFAPYLVFQVVFAISRV